MSDCIVMEMLLMEYDRATLSLFVVQSCAERDTSSLITVSILV
jgi:hypothetical protein